MEQILQSISRSEMLSLPDGLSSYKQVLISPQGQLKITFQTKWGTHAFHIDKYRRYIPKSYGYCVNRLISKVVVVYLDDITVFSKKREEHIMNLWQIFNRCRKYGILLNPKKSKEGMEIDASRIDSISLVPLPSYKKSMQSFLGRN